MTPAVPDTMQAVAIHAPGPPEVVGQALPRPGESEVLTTAGTDEKYRFCEDLEDAAAAHELMESSRHMGKIVRTVAAEARETTDND